MTKCKMIKHIILYFFLFFTINDKLNANDVSKDTKNILLPQGPLFVSLGSYCEPAHVLKHLNMRKIAFPFDWITSMDGEQLINILEEDFANFLNEDYFSPEKDCILVNTYYNLEFLHEGEWLGNHFTSNLKKLNIKYDKRIKRFRLLSYYKDKIFFIRTSFTGSVTNPSRYSLFKDLLEISDVEATKIYNALKNRFPNLNFTLLIINTHDGPEVIIEKKLAKDLIKIRSNPYVSNEIKFAAYKKFYIKFLGKELFEQLVKP